MQFGEKRTDKHFKKLTNVVLGKKQTDNHFEKKAKCSFGEIELQKMNGQTFQKNANAVWNSFR